MTYEERARVFEVLRELAKKHAVPILTATQPRPAYREPEPRRGVDLVIIDYPNILRP